MKQIISDTIYNSWIVTSGHVGVERKDIHLEVQRWASLGG